MRKRNAIIAGIGAAIILGVSGCASLTEPWNDAPIHHKFDDPANVGSMPDGYANFAEKCDESGHLILTTRGADGAGKDVAVITDHAACPKPGAPVPLSGQRGSVQYVVQSR
jgi:hypothetical protein